ncbi:MAG: hypothetical protein VX642_10750 [Bdellovibrionota bacterium]|nr:hypothetical protein [Bdellovibrionota bacterium]
MQLLFWGIVFILIATHNLEVYSAEVEPSPGACYSDELEKEDFELFKKFLNDNFLNYLDKCEAEFPEITKIIQSARAKFRSGNLNYLCKNLSGNTVAGVYRNSSNLDSYNVFWDLAKLKKNDYPYFETDRLKVLGILFHELLHLDRMDNRSQFDHNNKPFEILSKEKRFRKIPITKSKMDRVYLLNSACSVANSEKLLKSSYVDLQYGGRHISEVKFDFIDLCQKSMVYENRNGFPLSKSSASSFCTKLEKDISSGVAFFSAYLDASRKIEDQSETEARVVDCAFEDKPDDCAKKVIKALDVPINERKHLDIFDPSADGVLEEKSK